MARQANWKRHGYDTAKGKRGTGDMKFTKDDAKSFSIEYPIEQYPDGIPLDVIDDFVHHWLYTSQFKEEAGDSMKKWANIDSKKYNTGDLMSNIYEKTKKESEWEFGYFDHMSEVFSKMKIKVEKIE